MTSKEFIDNEVITLFVAFRSIPAVVWVAIVESIYVQNISL